MRDVTQSGHFYFKNYVEHVKYKSCPECKKDYYHAWGCSESRLNWDKELEDMKED